MATANNETISLREFDAMMQEGGYDYSVLVICQLEEAAGYSKKAKEYTEAWQKKYFGQAYAVQLDALQTAEYEAKNGKMIEPVLSILSMTDEEFIRQIWSKWRIFLSHVGRPLPKFEEVQNGK